MNGACVGGTCLRVLETHLHPGWRTYEHPFDTLLLIGYNEEHENV
jgi:hypothetical protein